MGQVDRLEQSAVQETNQGNPNKLCLGVCSMTLFYQDAASPVFLGMGVTLLLMQQCA